MTNRRSDLVTFGFIGRYSNSIDGSSVSKGVRQLFHVAHGILDWFEVLSDLALNGSVLPERCQGFSWLTARLDERLSGRGVRGVKLSTKKLRTEKVGDGRINSRVKY